MIDDPDHENIRHTAASLLAHQFLIEMLYSHLFAQAGASEADVFIAQLLRVASDTSELKAKDDIDAELYADIAVRHHGIVGEILNRAKARAGLAG